MLQCVHTRHLVSVDSGVSRRSSQLADLHGELLALLPALLEQGARARHPFAPGRTVYATPPAGPHPPRHSAEQLGQRHDSRSNTPYQNGNR